MKNNKAEGHWQPQKLKMNFERATPGNSDST